MLLRRSIWIYLCILSITLLSLCRAEEQAEGDEGEDKKGTRPRGLEAEVLNSTTISLTWKPPKITTEDCPVKKYVLRLKQDGARRSRAWKVDGARRALGLHNLKAETLYSIRLVAITACAGKGKPSKWMDVRTTDPEEEKPKRSGNDARSPREEPSGIESRPPGRPTAARTRTFPESVVLSWQVPTETEIVIRGYMVGYGEGVPDVNWQYVDASQRNITIKNLKPSTQYIISLRAFNNVGKGPTVYDMIYTRAMSVGPTVDPDSVGTPENLKAKVLSPTNIWLQWRDESLGTPQQMTDNRYYNVHYRGLPDGEKLSVVVKALHVVLYELTPGSSYEFKVRTVKDSYYSDFSETITNTTYETAPGSAPKSVTVAPINGSTGALISWRAPKEPNGQIKGYLVLHCSDRLKPIAEWNALATAETNAVVDGLSTGITYYFKVQARNNVGYGPLSKTSVLTIPIDWPDNTAVNVIIPDTEDVQNPQNVTDQRPGADAISSGNTPPNASGILEIYDENYPENGSSKNKRHDMFGVTAGPQVTKSKSTMSEVQFAAKVLHTISAFITWPAAPPACNCDVSGIKYVFHLYMRGKEETPNMQQLDSNVVHLQDLDPNERYHYQIKYIFPNGTETAWSQEQALDTDC